MSQSELMTTLMLHPALHSNFLAVAVMIRSHVSNSQRAALLLRHAAAPHGRTNVFVSAGLPIEKPTR